MAGLLKGVTDTGKKSARLSHGVEKIEGNGTNMMLSSRRYCRSGWKHCRRCHQGVCFCSSSHKGGIRRAFLLTQFSSSVTDTVGQTTQGATGAVSDTAGQATGAG